MCFSEGVQRSLTVARSTAKSELSGSNPGAPTARSPGAFGESGWVELRPPVISVHGRPSDMWIGSGQDAIEKGGNPYERRIRFLLK